MRAVEELERYGGNSEHSCAMALRGLVASMTITPLARETAAPLMSEKSQAMLARLADVAEKVRVSTAKLNEQKVVALHRGSDVQLPRAVGRLSQQAQKLEEMILDRQRTMHRDRERGVDPPPR